MLQQHNNIDRRDSMYILLATARVSVSLFHTW